MAVDETCLARVFPRQGPPSVELWAAFLGPQTVLTPCLRYYKMGSSPPLPVYANYPLGEEAGKEGMQDYRP